MFEVDENNSTLHFVYNNEISEKQPIKDQPLLKEIKMHFSVPPYQIFGRIFLSLWPPIVTKKYQKIYVDLFGPIFATLILFGLLNYGYSLKTTSVKLPPTEFLLIYMISMPIITYVFIHLAKSDISFIELLSVLGYSLFGHIFTLIISYFLDDDYNNYFFFVGLMILGGLSTLRIAMILIATIPKPALRLVICSFVATVQLLFLVFIHFAYMKKFFVYGSG